MERGLCPLECNSMLINKSVMDAPDLMGLGIEAEGDASVTSVSNKVHIVGWGGGELLQSAGVTQGCVKSQGSPPVLARRARLLLRSLMTMRIFEPNTKSLLGVTYHLPFEK